MGWKFATSIAGAAELRAAINTGQWQARTPAGMAGWKSPAVSIDPVRLADVDYLSARTDAPAHARYEGVLQTASLVTIAELGFWPWGGDNPTQGGAAQLLISDPDGLCDGLMDADLFGLPVAIRLGDEDGAVADASAVARFVVSGIESQDDATKLLQLGDAHADLDESLTRGVFLPNIPALAWQPQPVVIGAVASVPAIVTNSDGSSLWLSDGPLASVGDVMDRGDIMEPGTFEVTPDQQQLFMYSPPAGPVVADVSSVGPSQAPATLEIALGEMMRRIGKEAWSSSDAAAIDVATGYAGIGYYAGESISVRDAMAHVLPSYGAWWWQGPNGVLRFARVVDPATVADVDLAFEVGEADLMSGLERLPDDAPNLSRRMSFRPNARALAATDIVTDMVDVPPARRAALTRLYRGQAFAAGPISERYRHADTAEPMLSCFWEQADAQAEIERVCALYALQRWFYRIRLNVEPEQLYQLKPGAVGRLTHSRYGLAAGAKLLIRRVEINWATGDVAMILWG